MLLLLAFCTGCSTLLPSGTDQASSKWKTYQQAENTINKIVPNKTTATDLKRLGIDFKKTPNLKKLTYLDVMETFKLDSTVFNNLKLPPGIEEALNKHDKCKAYELSLNVTTSKRVGSFWKDILGFHQISKQTGWSFKALIVLVDDTVIYVLHSGSPKIDKVQSTKKPLGPFQSIDAGTIIDAVDGL
jgi:hypothetical protein